MSEYTAFLRSKDEEYGPRTYAQYFGTADEAMDQARVDYPNLELMAISEGPSIEIRRQQIEEYGRVFSNDEERIEYLKEKSKSNCLETNIKLG